MTKRVSVFLIIAFGLTLSGLATMGHIEARGWNNCQPNGNYAFSYTGHVYDGDSVTDLTEVGTFKFANGELTGSGILRLHFTQGPHKGLDLTLKEDFRSDSIEQDGCGGTIHFTAIWEDGQIFQRSIGYVAARNGTLVEFQSESPGTIASGRGVRQLFAR